MEYMIGYIIGVIIWAIIWGFAAKAIAENKGYEDEGIKWFWLGFFFSFIAVIIVATKPQKTKTVYQATPSSSIDGLLENGAWKCDCGRVNYKEAETCRYCGKVRSEIRVIESTIKTKENNSPVSEEISAVEQIKAFKELLDDGIITQEEFDAKKKQLLGL